MNLLLLASKIVKKRKRIKMNDDKVEFLIGDIITYDDIEYFKIIKSTPFSDGRYGFEVNVVRCAKRGRQNHNFLNSLKGKVTYNHIIYNGQSFWKKVDLNYLQKLLENNKEVLGL